MGNQHHRIAPTQHQIIIILIGNFSRFRWDERNKLIRFEHCSMEKSNVIDIWCSENVSRTIQNGSHESEARRRGFSFFKTSNNLNSPMGNYIEHKQSNFLLNAKRFVWSRAQLICRPSSSARRYFYVYFAFGIICCDS